VGHQARRGEVLLLGHVAVDGLVVRVGEETVQPARVHVVRVARLLRELVVDAMRDDVDLVRHDLDGEVAADELVDLVAERERAVRSIPVEPHGPVGAEPDHRVDDAEGRDRQAVVLPEEDHGEGNQAQRPEPVGEREPVLPVAEDVDPVEELAPELARGRLVELTVALPAVPGWLEEVVEDGR
jgi:hypothetical protein